MKTIIWKGIAYDSVEYFNLTAQNDSFVVQSRIIGAFEGDIYYVEYAVTLDAEWHIQHFTILYEINTIKHNISGEIKNAVWTINGVPKPDLADCQFIDITLTPFTNTLPINNLKLPIGEHQTINVFYIDILENKAKPVKQKYTRLSERVYKYENVPNDFEAEIVVDDMGLVEFYPSLFERVYEQ